MATRSGLIVVAALAMLCQRVVAEDTFPVAPQLIGDDKAVFATVESANIVPARARIGGTVVQLAVRQGDRVEQGQPVATVADKKFALQINALDAQIAGLQAELAKAKTDLERAQDLFARGTTSKVALDTAQTTFDVAFNALKARTAERSVIEQQIAEGKVLAPTAGRVLTVPVTAGTVDPTRRAGGDRCRTEFRAATARAGAACPLSPKLATGYASTAKILAAAGHGSALSA